MPVIDVVNKVEVTKTPRLMQLNGLFDVAIPAVSECSWKIDLPIEKDDWNIGLIVGPSGSGKSSVARTLFADQYALSHDWPANKSIVDGFPASMSIKEITQLLSSVGFSSPPSWVRPYSALSTGEQFRVTVARALAECSDLAVLDEFTSVVDRTVARIGSAAVAKAVRIRKQKFIAVTCHYDVADWLQPDWILEMPDAVFTRRLLQRRPAIQLEIRRVHKDTWHKFKRYHYLSSSTSSAATCFAGYVDGNPVAFASCMHVVNSMGGNCELRTVCLPDWQGIGIGNAISEFVAGVMRAVHKNYYSVTGNPAMIRHRARSPLWVMTRKPSRNTSKHNSCEQIKLNKSVASDRLTCSFKYVGPPRIDDAKQLGLLCGKS